MSDMCSGYDQTTPNEIRINGREISGWMSTTPLVRSEGMHPRGTGLVVAKGRTGIETAVPMHWGVTRPDVGKEILFARTESLRSGTWSKVKRAVIPIDRLFESDWQGVPWSFYRPMRETFWIGAVWENHPVKGLCFALITKLAERPVLNITDRMTCCLSDEEATDFLDLNRPAARALAIRLHGTPREGWKQKH